MRDAPARPAAASRVTLAVFARVHPLIQPGLRWRVRFPPEVVICRIQEFVPKLEQSVEAQVRQLRAGVAGKVFRELRRQYRTRTACAIAVACEGNWPCALRKS